ncbi:MAG: EpsG family protein [Paraprevotella sp.]|nr:EpsG family protein [Paraprevotella sp.]MCI6201215.1 EpsG family protein [Paraprevotella sp.]
MNFSAPYILLLGFYGFMAWWYHASKSSKSHTWNVIACMVVTLLFWGFRGFIFYDWMSYYPLFQEINIKDISNSNIWSIEPGFALLMIACKITFNNFHFFVFICTTINCILLMRYIIKHVENFPFGIFIYTCIAGIFLFTDLMRNALSIFIFINGIDYISKRKSKKYFLVCTLAMTFHYSSIFFFPLYFFANRKISKWLFAVIFFVGCLIYATQITILSSSIETIVGFINPDIEEKIHFYITEIANNRPGLNIVFFERIFTSIMVICYLDKLRSLRKDANIYINFLLLFMCMNLYLHEFVTMSFRLSLLFGVGYLIIWNDLVKCINIENNKKMFVIFIFAYCFLRLYGHTRNVLANYDNILFEYKTYQQKQSIFNKNFKEQ